MARFSAFSLFAFLKALDACSNCSLKFLSATVRSKNFLINGWRDFCFHIFPEAEVLRKPPHVVRLLKRSLQLAVLKIKSCDRSWASALHLPLADPACLHLRRSDQDEPHTPCDGLRVLRALSAGHGHATWQAPAYL